MAGRRAVALALSLATASALQASPRSAPLVNSGVARRAGAPLRCCAPSEPLVRTAEVSSSPAAEFHEVWLNPAAQSYRDSLAECIQHCDVVVCVPNVASDSELRALHDAGIGACNTQVQWSADGKNRFSVSDPMAFEQDTVFSCEEIMLRVLDRVDEEMPSVYETLFRPAADWADRQPLTAKGLVPNVVPPLHLTETCPSLRDLYMAGELEWSEGEPAINVYTENGGFGTHKDHMALTVLLPLTAPDADFAGGGTGFWSRADEEQGEGIPDFAPTKVIRPPLGTALLFGGDLTHAGMPVESGVRSVFVCSFSTRTDASPADRVNGLQGATSSSSLRERNEMGSGASNGLPAPTISVAGGDPGGSANGSESAPSGAGSKASAKKEKPSAMERLQQLNELQEMGLVTPDEYEQKRKEILSSL